MRAPPKVGRLASKEERQRAQDIVDLYRRAVANGGSVVLNPEDAHDEQTTYYADAAVLLHALEGFAREGTFAVTMDFRPLIAGIVAKSAGPRYDDRVHAVTDRLHVSERTAQRLIGRRRPPRGP